MLLGTMPIPRLPVELIWPEPGNVVAPVRVTLFIVAPDVNAAQLKFAMTCPPSAVVPFVKVLGYDVHSANAGLDKLMSAARGTTNLAFAYRMAMFYLSAVRTLTLRWRALT